jgi:hypothetical protein
VMMGYYARLDRLLLGIGVGYHRQVNNCLLMSFSLGHKANCWPDVGDYSSEMVAAVVLVAVVVLAAGEVVPLFVLGSFSEIPSIHYRRSPLQVSGLVQRD